MVDEFQDTNRLQCEIVDLLAEGPEGKELFFVGDEFQSIYRFRHADVEVFRERREQSGGVLALHAELPFSPARCWTSSTTCSPASSATSSSRSRPRAGSPIRSSAPPVELLVTDKASYAGTPTHWRRAEARHIAARVRELVDSRRGERRRGRAPLRRRHRRRALRGGAARGRPARPTARPAAATSASSRSSTCSRTCGCCTTATTTRRSPPCWPRRSSASRTTRSSCCDARRRSGRSTALRARAPRQPLGRGPAALSRRSASASTASCKAANGLPLERLCERIVTDHDYDLAVLAQLGRAPPLREPAQAGAAGALVRGAARPRHRGLRALRARPGGRRGRGEAEAFAEEEDGDAVRLLTIHAAKGLEFQVVVVADAGRDRNAPSPDEILCLPDGRFGFRVADPATGSRRPAFDYEQVREAEREAERAERLRLYYVAMTRAIDRLIVSGAIDPGRTADQATPIGWVLARLEAEELDAAGDGPVELVRDGARLLVRVDRHREAEAVAVPVEAAAAPEAAEEGQLSLFAGEDEAPLPPPAPRLPELPPVPAPPLHRVRSLSYSALALFDRCSYRYYAERVAGLRAEDAHGSVPGTTGLAATEIGDAVHRLLETVDLAAPVAPDVEAVRAWYPAVTDEELERIRGFVGVVLRLGARPADRRARRRRARAALRVRARRCAPPRPPRRLLERRRPRARRRLQDELAGRGHARGDRGGRLPAAAARLRARLLADRSRGGRGRLPLPRAARRGRLDAVHGRRHRGARGRALGRDRPDHAGEFAPTPSECTCSGCPALDLVCAGPRLLSVQVRRSTRRSSFVSDGDLGAA